MTYFFPTAEAKSSPRFCGARLDADALLNASFESSEHTAILLDAATHGIPHDAMQSWDARIPEGRAAYPYRIEHARFFGEAPTSGKVRVEARFLGFETHAHIALQLIERESVFCELELVEVLLPKGPIGLAAPLDRQAFLRDRKFIPNVALTARISEHESRLDMRDLAASNWLPGTIEHVYRIAPGQDVALQVAIRDHVGQHASTHPSRIEVASDASSAISQDEPLLRHPVHADRDAEGITITGSGPALDLSSIRDFWRKSLGIGAWPGEDLTLALIERFMRRVHFTDPDGWAKVRGRSAIFLANHQVGIESLLFGITISALHGRTTLTLAKKEHGESWLGRLVQHLFSYPGIVDPRVIAYFDRADPASMPRILKELGAMMKSPGKNVTIHVEGTRATSSAHPVTNVSRVFVDMAIGLGAPIVPVRFVGGLPREDVRERLEFPFGMGRQDYFIGTPIEPSELNALPFEERTARVLSAINSLGPGHATEAPFESDPTLEEKARSWEERTGTMHPHAVILNVLEQRKDRLGPELQELVRAAHEGSLKAPNNAQGRWLTELAKRLYGPRSPKVLA